ncbi:MAG: membrane protein insertase YidC [Leptospiraceae bacterium]|nr:membrane protein insertase YidC [Leptospiraceae bacterium]
MLPFFRCRFAALRYFKILTLLSTVVHANTDLPEPREQQITLRGSRDKTYRIETENFTVVFAEQGGQIKEFRNRDPHYPRRDGANVVIPEMEIFLAPYIGTTEPAQYAAQNLKASMDAAYRFNTTEDSDKITVTANAPMLFVADGRKFDAVFVKEFVFLKKAPYFKFALEIRPNAAFKLQNLMLYALPIIGPVPEGSPGTFRDYHHYSVGEKFELAYTGSTGGFGCGSSPPAEKIITGAADFFGSSSRFLILNLQPLFATRSLSITPELRHAETKKLLQPQALHVNLGDAVLAKDKPARFEFLGYMGPKKEENLHPDDNARRVLPELAKLHRNLYKSFDFGITEPIRDIIVSALNLLYKLIPNYGIGIILIALLLKLLFYPLNQRQAEAMKRLSELQPKIQEINERYKNNPEEKQRRMVELYKTHKVNPLSGCLPMLIQLPVFIAMYSAFSDAYDLWQSPFIPGWIPDLSQPDLVYSLPAHWPLLGGFGIHLLPIIMTLTQYYQTKLTPTSGDENQRKVMLLLPFLLLFIFYSLPAGVVLYWTVQNILSIAQQLYTNYRTTRSQAS